MSVFYRKMPDSEFYDADAQASRTALKRNILHRSESITREIEALRKGALSLPPGSPQLRRQLCELLEGVLLLCENLNLLTGGRDTALYPVMERIESGLREHTSSFSHDLARFLTRSLQDAGATPDKTLLGNKAAALARLVRILPGHIPDGFVVTTDAYHLLMEKNENIADIQRLLTDLDVIKEYSVFRSRTNQIREIIQGAFLPEEILREMVEREEACSSSGKNLWAVRSSCVGEEGRRTFAGQFDTFLNVRQEQLGEMYLKVVASRYTDRAVYYRMVSKCREVDAPMAVLFMPMIQTRSSGVAYTKDPRYASADTGLINAVRGPAANLLSGRKTADTFTLSRSAPCELQGAASDSTALNADEASRLFRLGLDIEETFGSPQDIE